MDENDLVAQADEAAILQMEAWTLGLHDPAIWDKYVKAWTDNVERRINAGFGLDQSPAGAVAS